MTSGNLAILCNYHVKFMYGKFAHKNLRCFETVKMLNLLLYLQEKFINL